MREVWFLVGFICATAFFAVVKWLGVPAFTDKTPGQTALATTALALVAIAAALRHDKL